MSGNLHVLRASSAFVFFPEAVRRNLSLSNATDSEIQCEIVRCLQGALDRDGGRRARMKRRATAAAAAAVPTPMEASTVSDENDAGSDELFA